MLKINIFLKSASLFFLFTLFIIFSSNFVSAADCSGTLACGNLGYGSGPTCSNPTLYGSACYYTGTTCANQVGKSCADLPQAGCNSGVGCTWSGAVPCTSGPCCVGGFVVKNSGVSCNEALATWSCTNQKIMTNYQTQNCDGTSASCTGQIIPGSSVYQDCTSSDSYCNEGQTSSSPFDCSVRSVCTDPSGEFSRLCKDGSIGYHNFSCNKVIKDGNVIGLEGFLIDSTERKQAELAIKFTNYGGAINISAEENSENVTISVSDNGTGIPPDNLSKLFDISEVLTTKGTAKETGTGLGLLLCKEFVEKHGGKIWVEESEYGKGSDFKFTMPIFTEQANAINN